MSSTVLTAVHQRRPRMTGAEERIADFILADPDAIPGLTITALAEASGVSTGSIVRFCRGVADMGYPEFRLALASELGRESRSRERFKISDGEVSPTDTPAQTVSKIAFMEAETIERTARDLDLDALENVVESLISARRIDIYGSGSSALAGQDLQHKLHRAGYFAQSWTDQHLALTSSSLLGAEDVAIALSHSGRTQESVEALRIARATGAITIAITNAPESPLALAADLVLTTAANETRYRSGAMASRIAQLAVIDFIFVRIAQRGFDRMASNLHLSFEAVKGHRID